MTEAIAAVLAKAIEEQKREQQLVAGLDDGVIARLAEEEAAKIEQPKLKEPTRQARMLYYSQAKLMHGYISNVNQDFRSYCLKQKSNYLKTVASN